jgi:hypothetical protein
MFTILVFLAYRARRDAAAHKRFILIATAALLGPAFARFHVSFLYRRFLAPLFVSYCFLLLLALYDLWATHKLHRARLRGSGLVIGVGLLRLPLAHTSAWQSFAAWAQTHARWLA